MKTKIPAFLMLLEQLDYKMFVLSNCFGTSGQAYVLA